jgi:hypothetical protein
VAPEALAFRKAQAADAKADEAPSIVDPKAHEDALRATGLLDAALPEAAVLHDAPADVVAKLSREERDRLSLAEALARANEIEANDDGTLHTGSKYDFDLSAVPVGWHYEWRRDTVLNERDPAYQTDLAKRGWRAVPRSRHPTMMPTDWTGGDYIIRGGMILMEIPKAIADKIREDDRRKAAGVIQAKEQQLSGRPADRPQSFPRRGSTAREFGPILGPGETAYRQ